jgi:hypothetical protein
LVTQQARRDVLRAMSALDLPADTWPQIARCLRGLKSPPSAEGRLEGRWAPARFVLGPWPWMILLYRCDEAADEIFLVAMHDARAVASAGAPAS